jgi:hypothetical protein
LSSTSRHLLRFWRWSPPCAPHNLVLGFNISVAPSTITRNSTWLHLHVRVKSPPLLWEICSCHTQQLIVGWMIIRTLTTSSCDNMGPPSWR